ncbi:hypothetical protein NUW54_g9108 [Trametes sanguinea]|uniref:Uncharacterized protein n=1 Tax=Trametes sanguinea TaxID=158606 RepID=A0ACC1P8G7_9APHY|nr:hypothetical protein NUW54_g9108 [Trametes sanguinea]
MEGKDTTHTMKVAGVVTFYMAAALVMVFVNKAVMISSPDLPLLFLLIQLTLAVVLLHGASIITTKVEIPKLELKTAKKLAPVTLVNVVGLVFNLLCLRGVDASFFQIARGLQLPLTIIVSGRLCWILHRPSSELHFGGPPPRSSQSPLYRLRLLSSLFIAIHAVLIKYSLPHAQNSAIQLAYWQNLGSALLLAPFILLQGELSKLAELTSSPTWNAEVFVWGSIVTGVFGFLLCVAGLLSIKITSPVTHMFSSAARSAIQTLLGVWLFNDLLTVNRAVSILVIAAGTMFYTWVKSTENTPAPARPTMAPPKDDIEANGGTQMEHIDGEVHDWQDEKRRHPA